MGDFVKKSLYKFKSKSNLMNLVFVVILKRFTSIPYVIPVLCFGKVLSGIVQAQEIFSLALLSW